MSALHCRFLLLLLSGSMLSVILILLRSSHDIALPQYLFRSAYDCRNTLRRLAQVQAKLRPMKCPHKGYQAEYGSSAVALGAARVIFPL